MSSSTHSPTFSFAATGDSFISRRLSEGNSSAAALAALIRQADFRFTNLETTVRHDSDGFPSAQSGGTWASATPECLGDLTRYAFNAAAWATNHTLDYSYGGLEATERALDAVGLVHAGAGKTLAAAGAPRYVEAAQGRIALLALTSSFHESWLPANPRLEAAGRPGINPLRFSTLYRVAPERLEALKAAAGGTGINATHELRVKEGFALADGEGTVRFGTNLFVATAAGEAEGASTRPHAGDLKRLQASIAEAAKNADLVVVSIHSHEMQGRDKEVPAEFFVEAARACIDAGAHAIVGHGPHLVRGIEIYKKRPIFYSLGNFIFQNETVSQLPADFFDQYDLGPDCSVADALLHRSQGETKGFAVNPKIWASVVATWRMKAGELEEIVLHPITLGPELPRYLKGWPSLTKECTVLETLQRLSAPFGTRLCIENGLGIWRPE